VQIPETQECIRNSAKISRQNQWATHTRVARPAKDTFLLAAMPELA